MRTPQLPEPRRPPNFPSQPVQAQGQNLAAMSGNPMSRMFAPLTSGMFAQRAGRRSLIGGGGAN